MRGGGGWASAAAGGVLLVSALGCGGADFTLRFLRPPLLEDEIQAFEVTAVVPVLAAETGAEFLPCGALGWFPSEGRRRPGRPLEDDPRPVEVYANASTFGLDEEARIEFADRPRLRDADDPWGAVALYVAALGSDGAPVLEGCTCLRTYEGTHSDGALDRQVLEACAPIREIGGLSPVTEVELLLSPVVSAPARLVACQGDSVSAVVGAPPGVGACLEVPPCEDQTQASCRCPDCTDLSGAPIFLRRTDPGGAVTTKLLRSDRTGQVRATVGGDCRAGAEIGVGLVGDDRPPLHFSVGCVTAPPARCRAEVKLERREGRRGPIAFSGADGRGWVAAISGVDSTVLELYDGAGQPVGRTEFVGERFRGGVGVSAEQVAPPRLLLATSGAPPEGLRLRTIELQAGTASVVQTIDAALGAGGCPPERCGSGEWSNGALLAAADLDGDGRLDGAAGRQGGAPLWIFPGAGDPGVRPAEVRYHCRGAETALLGLQAAFFNGRGAPPVLLGASDTGVSVLHGPGDRSCQPPVRLTLSGDQVAFTAAPLRCRRGQSCDAPDDVLALRRRGLETWLAVVRGDEVRYTGVDDLEGRPGALRSLPLPQDTRPSNLLALDWNGDGTVDVLSVRGGASLGVGGWLGDGTSALADLAFAPAEACGGPCTVGGVTSADTDGDGRGELIVGCDLDLPSARLLWLQAQP